MIPDRLMEAHTRISLPVNKLNVSSPEGDDNNLDMHVRTHLNKHATGYL
jgi:hypothetical protein